MRRGLALLVGAALAFAALSSAPTASVPEPASTQSVAPARFRACVARADRGSAPVLAAASAVPGPMTVSVTGANELVPAADAVIGSAGGAVVPLADSGLVGFGTVLAELPGDVVETSVLSRGDRGRATHRCPGRPEPVMAASGISTLDGERVTLVLGNPFAVDAVVAVTGASEVGEDSPSELASVLVPARSTVTAELGRLLPLREHLSLVLTTERGAVVGLVAQAGDGDVATTAFVPPAGDWWITLPDVGQSSATLTFVSAAPTEVEYQVDVYAGGVLETSVETGRVAPGRQVVVDLSEVAVPAGIRVTATGPILAGLSITGEHLRASSPGVNAPGDRWLVAGPGVGGPSILWVLNPGPDPLDVVVQPLTSGAQSRVEEVAPSSVTPIPVGSGSGGGYLVEAVGDVVVMWTFGGEGPTALGAGVPLDE